MDTSSTSSPPPPSTLARFAIQAMVFAAVSYPLLVLALTARDQLVAMPFRVTIAFAIAFVVVEAGLFGLVSTLFDGEHALTDQKTVAHAPRFGRISDGEHRRTS